MIISKIYSMWWGDADHATVGLVADTTDEGTNLTIGTVYDESSIIWQWVKEFPKDQIKEFIENDN